jgi:tetratricopeptide (TPR) repeat protein
MEKIELTHFIERYLDNAMSKEERNWFEKELQGNQWLQQELTLRRKANIYAAEKEVIDFRQKLQAAGERHRKLAPAGQTVRKKAVQYAAFFAGLIILGTLYFTIPGNSSNSVERITSSTLSSVDPVIITRSDNANNSSSNWDMAVSLYNRGDYKAAVTCFEKILAEKNEEGVKTSFMLGVSKMRLEEYNEAVNPFEKVVSHNDNLFIEDAKWYLGICYLNIDEKDKAIATFESIAADSGNRYNKMARKSLRKIK